jgi:hypothetical protein
MAAVYENPAVEMVVFVVIPHEADLVENHPVRGASEFYFRRGGMPAVEDKAEDGRIGG